MAGYWWASVPVGTSWQVIRCVSEFFNGRHSACGPAAHELLRAAMSARNPSQGNMEVITERDIAHGWYTEGTGQTSQQVLADIALYDAAAVTASGGVLNANGYTDTQVRVMLQSMPDGVGGFICEVAQAGNLIFNEHGVAYHFVAIVGYDSAADKVLVSNPDRVPRPSDTALYTPDWLPLEDLVSAKPVAFVDVRTNTPSAPAIIINGVRYPLPYTLQITAAPS